MEKFYKKIRKIEHWKIISTGLAVYDALAAFTAFFLALWFRFDCEYTAIPKEYLSACYRFAPLYMLFVVFVFWRLHLYNALWFRFDCEYTAIPKEYLSACYRFAPLYMLFVVFVFWRLHLYNSIWRFASYSELLRVVAATAVTFVAQCVGVTLFFERMPFSYYFFGGLIQFTMTLGIRF